MDLDVCGQINVIIYYIFFAVIHRGHQQPDETEPSIVILDNPIYEYLDGSFKDESYTIQTEGCNIPGFNFLDAAVRPFVHYPTDIKACNYSLYPLLEVNDTHLNILKENLGYYNVTKGKKVRCCIQHFTPRRNSLFAITNKNTRSRVNYSPCVEFKNTVLITHEFLKATCRSGSNVLYKQFYATTPKKKFTVQREHPFSFPENQPLYNVIMLGLSSMSRLNFHRTMPNTLNLLKKKDAIEYMGYNKVDSDLPNLIPVLLGMNMTEIKAICRPTLESGFDRCPFIWERYKDAGYYTAFAEDSALLGKLNSKRHDLSRFKYSPTDYYLHPFIRETEFVSNYTSSICMGDKYYFKVLLDYVENVLTTLNTYRLFGLFWESSLSSTNMNYPMFMDHAYEAFINKLEDIGHLNKTFLILLSDNGMGQGNIFKTTQGHIEEKLPVLFILPPPSFRKKFSFGYSNLQRNANRLTTAFDLHATLVDLIDLSSIKNTELLTRLMSSYQEDKSISLFMKVPRNRTCESAGINPDSCTCLRSKRTSVDSPESRQAGTFMVHHLNKILAPYPQCAQLKMKQLVDTIEMTSLSGEEKYKNYMIILRVVPGEALFEATLRHSMEAWELPGAVTRLNPSEEHTRCVQDFQLKMYCHCVDTLNKS